MASTAALYSLTAALSCSSTACIRSELRSAVWYSHSSRASAASTSAWEACLAATICRRSAARAHCSQVSRSSNTWRTCWSSTSFSSSSLRRRRRGEEDGGARPRRDEDWMSSSCRGRFGGGEQRRSLAELIAASAGTEARRTAARAHDDRPSARLGGRGPCPCRWPLANDREALERARINRKSGRGGSYRSMLDLWKRELYISPRTVYNCDCFGLTLRVLQEHITPHSFRTVIALG